MGISAPSPKEGRYPCPELRNMSFSSKVLFGDLEKTSESSRYLPGRIISESLHTGSSGASTPSTARNLA